MKKARFKIGSNKDGLQKEDNHKMIRVELHLHTNMSQMDSALSANEYIRYAYQNGYKAMAITDHGCVQAFPEAMETLERIREEGGEFKIIYGMEAYMSSLNRTPSHTRKDDKKAADEFMPFHMTILVQNQKGLKNLYKLVSWSNQPKYHRYPCITKEKIAQYREGLIIGSGCEEGELFRAIAARKPQKTLVSIASAYDFLEILPSAKKKDNQTIHKLGKKLKIPVCATGNAHYIKMNDKFYRFVLLYLQKLHKKDIKKPLHFLSTKEMLQCFKYLGKKNAITAVITNTNAIADSVEEIRPIPLGRFEPKYPKADETLNGIVQARIQNQIDETIPRIVEERISQEMKCIRENNFATRYMVASKLVKDSEKHGYPVGYRGNVGASYVAYLLGITGVNPLPPHYYCKTCKYMEFVTDGQIQSGYDLPEKPCPNCNESTGMHRDGQDIPFESFAGIHGERLPSIDLNISTEYHHDSCEYLRKIFRKNRIYSVSMLHRLTDETAKNFYKDFAYEFNLDLDASELQEHSKNLVGVKYNTGRHPGGLMILPEEYDAEDFTPLQYAGIDKRKDVKSTHFDSRSLQQTTLIQNIYRHKTPTIFKYLEEYTGYRVNEIPMSDRETYMSFTSLAPFGVTCEEIDYNTGTLAIPDLETAIARIILLAYRPKGFADLVQIYGFLHGVTVLWNNADELLTNGIITLDQAIATSDSIMLTLIRCGFSKEDAYKIMRMVSKEKGVTSLPKEIHQMMLDHGVPDWYIQSCEKMEYLIPKAHAVAYVADQVRMAWFKRCYPVQFYAAYFTVKNNGFDAELALNGSESIKKKLVAQDTFCYYSPTNNSYILHIVYEALARGITFLPPQKGKSSRLAFTVEEGKIRLPLKYLKKMKDRKLS